jgi:hypothetical protein
VFQGVLTVGSHGGAGRLFHAGFAVLFLLTAGVWEQQVRGARAVVSRLSVGG